MKKRWLIILIFMFVGLGILISVTLPHQPSIKTESVRFSSGTYTVGKQIPVGVYKIFPNNSDQSYTIKMAKTTIGNSTYNYDFSYNFKGQIYLDITDVKSVILEDATAFPIKENSISQAISGKCESGQYKVGQDIPAGSYTAYTEDRSTGSSLTISAGPIKYNIRPAHKFIAFNYVSHSDLPSNRNLSADITVKNGDYLILTNAYINIIK